MGSQSPRGPHQLAHHPAASQAPPPARGPQGSTLSGQGCGQPEHQAPCPFSLSSGDLHWGVGRERVQTLTLCVLESRWGLPVQ